MIAVFANELRLLLRDRGAILWLVLGPVLVLYVAFARPFYATWWLLAGLGLFVGGFLLLVLRGPARREEDDPDAGARV